jgi:L-malate glycosyltransferase
MKILCITDRQDRPETELFLRLAKEVDRLTVMCNPNGRNYPLLKQGGVDLIPFEVKSRFDRESTARIRRELEKDDYGIAHAFNSRALACLLRAGKDYPARILGYRGVTTGVGHLNPESWHTFLNPRLDGVLCVSEAVRRSLINTRLLWRRFPAYKATTIHKGHDPSWYEAPPVPKPELGIPDGAKAICCIARNSSKKGALTLLNAFDRLPEALNVHLVFVGGIAANKRARARASRCRQSDRIHFTGYRTDAVAIIHGVDVLVSASESGEGLPRVVIEAMCVGTPVVATGAGGTGELVIHAETGLLVPQQGVSAMAAAIEQCITDPAGSARRAEAAFDRIVSEFHPSRTAAETITWYTQLVQDKCNIT